MMVSLCVAAAEREVVYLQGTLILKLGFCLIDISSLSSSLSHEKESSSSTILNWIIYKDRFLSSLPASHRASVDFTRPMFTVVAFYLCAKKHKLKVDKLKLIGLCGTSESEFSSVSITMKDLCHDGFGVAKEKKAPRDVKSNRDLLDVLPGKRKPEDGGYLSDDGPELSSYKKRKQMEKGDYEKWKSSVLASNNQNKTEAPCKRTKQTRLNFLKEAPETQKLEAV